MRLTPILIDGVTPGGGNSGVHPSVSKEAVFLQTLFAIVNLLVVFLWQQQWLIPLGQSLSYSGQRSSPGGQGSFTLVQVPTG